MRPSNMTKDGLRARLTLGVFALSAAGLLLPGGCGSNDFLGSEDYQRDILVWLLLDGQAGGTGLQCWDLDGDGVRDPAEDTNGDGVVDTGDCDGLSCWDLNGNGVGDLAEEDTNGDGVVDTGDCSCRVQLVFVLDTSGSMDDQAAEICSAITGPIPGDGEEFIVVDRQVLGIRPDLPPQPDTSLYTCLTPDSVSTLDDGVPTNGPPDDEEDWAEATAIVAQQFPWTDGVLRVIVPISDEDPEHDRASEAVGVCSVCEDPGGDRAAIDNAIAAAGANDVLVFPILGTEPVPTPAAGLCVPPDRLCVEELARVLASDLKLREFAPGVIQDIVRSACRVASGAGASEAAAE